MEITEDSVSSSLYADANRMEITEGGVSSNLYAEDYSEASVYHVKVLTAIDSGFKPILYCIIFFCGLVGNTLVLVILIRFKKLASVTDIYLLNMAISDLLFVFSLPFVVYSNYHQWVFGDAMCKILSAMYYIGFFSGIFFITVLSVDRYLAIVHVVFSLKFRTTRLGVMISLAIWSTSFLFSLPHFIFHKEVKSEFTSCNISYPEDKKVAMTLLAYLQVNIFGLILPLSILIFCYSQIAKNLQNSKIRQKQYAVKLVCVLVVVFFLFWAPYNIVLFLSVLEVCDAFDSHFSEGLKTAMDITRTVAFVHCCLNPIIYTFAGENFKKHLYQLFNKFLKCLQINRLCAVHEGSGIVRASSTFRESRSSSLTEAIL
ncbi:mitochondrial inner membrane protease subunit 2 isoform X2 [Hyperolius riggenbachi]